MYGILNTMIRPEPNNQEKILRESDFIVSKTDPKGIITYGNQIFIEYSGYSESELLGAPHNILRHPDMPALVFKLLWDTIKQGREIFAFVKNLSKDGSFYWVFAHVTPSYSLDGRLSGYYSVRRKPKDGAVSAVVPIYSQLLKLEKEHGRSRGMQLGSELLDRTLSEAGMEYDEFVLRLQNK